MVVDDSMQTHQAAGEEAKRNLGPREEAGMERFFAKSQQEKTTATPREEWKTTSTREIGPRLQALHQQKDCMQVQGY
jgi:hypothetical protein